MATWREEFFADLLRAGQARGIDKFEHDLLWKLIENTFNDEDAFKDERKKLKKHYRRALKMTATGRKKLLNVLEKQWPGYAPPVKRKNAAPKKKKHPGTNGAQAPAPPAPPTPPAPPAPPATVTVTPTDRPSWRGVYCSAMAGGCGKPTKSCQCYPGVTAPLAETAPGVFEGEVPIPPPPPPGAAIVPPPPPPGAVMVSSTRLNSQEEVMAPPPPPKPKSDRPCTLCGVVGEVEEWGESGEFWWHCHACDRDFNNTPTKINPECVACDATGLNSKGGNCSPCQANGFPVTGRCAECDDWQFTTPSGAVCINGHGGAPTLEAPAPPSPPAKTYGSPTAPPPPDYQAPRGKPASRVCFHTTLTPGIDKTVVVAALNSYLVEETGFGATVKDAAWLGENLVDLLVEYTVHITEAYKALLGHELVADAEAKPAADMGAVTA